jgi:hypothetical protein
MRESWLTWTHQRLCRSSVEDPSLHGDIIHLIDSAFGIEIGFWSQTCSNCLYKMSVPMIWIGSSVDLLQEHLLPSNNQPAFQSKSCSRTYYWDTGLRGHLREMGVSQKQYTKNLRLSQRNPFKCMNYSNQKVKHARCEEEEKSIPHY